MAISRKLMPSIQELIAFEAAGRHGNFTAAAIELALTQSAVSKQVRQLEMTLGIQLFNRVKGRVILTTQGERYIRSARRILERLEGATHEVIASSGSALTLKIAVLPTFASRWLIPRLPQFLDRHPALTISIMSEIQPFDFNEKLVDIAIHYGDPTWAQAKAVHLCNESIIAVAHPDYISAKKLNSAADLRNATLLQQATRPGLWQHWFAMVGVEHPYPYRGPVFDQFAMTSQAAIAGMGAALVPTFLVEHELCEHTLEKLAELPLPGMGAYYAIVPQRKQYDSAVASFVAWLIEASKNVSGEPAVRAHRQFPSK